MPYQDWEPKPPYQLTNRGIRTYLPFVPEEGTSGAVFIATLDCPAPPAYSENSFPAPYSNKISSGDEQYIRINLGQFAKARVRGDQQTVYVKQKTNDIAEMESLFPQQFFQLRMGPPTEIYKTVKVMTDPRIGGPLPKIITTSRDTARKLLPLQMTMSFVGPKVPGQLACAVIFERIHDLERVLVLLGPSKRMRAGFQAVELPPKTANSISAGQEMELSFQAFQELFCPGEVARLEHHELHVHVDTLVTGAIKYCMFDTDLELVEAPARFDKPVDGGTGLVHDRAIDVEDNEGVHSGSPRSRPRSQSGNEEVYKMGCRGLFLILAFIIRQKLCAS